MKAREADERDQRQRSTSGRSAASSCLDRRPGGRIVLLRRHRLRRHVGRPSLLHLQLRGGSPRRRMTLSSTRCCAVRHPAAVACVTAVVTTSLTSRRAAESRCPVVLYRVMITTATTAAPRSHRPTAATGAARGRSVRAVLPGGGDLLFCGHHGREHAARLREVAVEIHDDEGVTQMSRAGSGLISVIRSVRSSIWRCNHRSTSLSRTACGSAPPASGAAGQRASSAPRYMRVGLLLDVERVHRQRVVAELLVGTPAFSLSSRTPSRALARTASLATRFIPSLTAVDHEYVGQLVGRHRERQVLL